jgi:hypothetical protein
MTLHEFEKSIFYRAACECGSEDCDLTLELEKDSDIHQITLALYKDLYWAAYWHDDDKWYKNLWLRIKAALRILFIGRIKVEESFLFGSREQIEDFIKALESGMEIIDG